MKAAAALDLRALPAPQPLERVLDALEDLARSAILQVLLAREPHPLYRILEREGWRHHAEWQADGACMLSIWREA